MRQVGASPHAEDGKTPKAKQNKEESIDLVKIAPMVSPQHEKGQGKENNTGSRRQGEIKAHLQLPVQSKKIADHLVRGIHVRWPQTNQVSTSFLLLLIVALKASPGAGWSP